jgi:hypothetical protein
MMVGAVGGDSKSRLGWPVLGFLLPFYTLDFVNFSITRPIIPIVALIRPPHLGKNPLACTSHCTSSPAVLSNFPISDCSSGGGAILGTHTVSRKSVLFLVAR